MEGGIEALCCGLIEAFKEVPVGVEGGPDRSMSQPLLDHLRVLALCDQDGYVSVSQIVEPARFTH